MSVCLSVSPSVSERSHSWTVWYMWSKFRVKVYLYHISVCVNPSWQKDFWAKGALGATRDVCEHYCVCIFYQNDHSFHKWERFWNSNYRTHDDKMLIRYRNIYMMMKYYHKVIRQHSLYSLVHKSSAGLKMCPARKKNWLLCVFFFYFFLRHAKKCRICFSESVVFLSKNGQNLQISDKKTIWLMEFFF